jgi:2-dehydro-3-deoxyphosphooctonate aldolase (KDO 8-P synthase)
MEKFIIIAGPCLAESEYMVMHTAETLRSVCSKYPNVDFYFKASYKKANRTSYNSFTGVGDKIALKWLEDVRNQLGVKVLTDVHSPEEASLAAQYVDVLQIPAFLSRQTELLVAVGNTGLVCNIKKGQFLAPDDMKKAAAKVESTGNSKIWLTERGTCFGYHDLVVDFRSLLIMQEYGYPVIYDATHSLQQPSIGEQSGGCPQFITPLAKAAVAIGVDGIFFETHPNPADAKSDAATQLPLADAEKFISDLMLIRECVS